MPKRPALARRIRGKSQKGSRFVTSTDPDMTPLINCIFLLLVFFAVVVTGDEINRSDPVTVGDGAFASCDGAFAS